ncbi:hypothetical protein [Roseivivax sp.]
MSAPDTNVEKQEQNHRPSLLGIKAALIYGVVLLTIFVIYVTLAAGDEEAGLAGDDTAGSSMVEGETEATALENYKEEGYEPGGNSTGSVQIQDQ